MTASDSCTRSREDRKDRHIKSKTTDGRSDRDNVREDSEMIEQAIERKVELAIELKVEPRIERKMEKGAPS